MLSHVRRHNLRLLHICLAMFVLMSQACLLDERAKDDDDDDDPIVITDPGNTGNPITPGVPNDPVNSPVKLVQVGYFVAPGNTFMTHIAHLLGKPFGVDMEPIHLTTGVIQNTSSTPQEVIIKVSLAGYAEPVRQKVSVPASSSLDFSLTPAMDFEELYKITSGAPANIEVEVSKIDGSLLDLTTAQIKILPVNHVTWAIPDGEGGATPLYAFVSTLVTPEDKGHAIQSLITAAARRLPSMAISSYVEGDEEHTALIAAALYYELHERGIIYTNVTGSFFNNAQNVKLPAQSLETNSANCIDGALVFASAFEAIGFEPVILIVPGHAFVGVRLQAGGTILPIETTLVSAGDFDVAVNSAHNTFIKNQENNSLTIIDVVTMRKLGVSPVNL